MDIESDSSNNIDIISRLSFVDRMLPFFIIMSMGAGLLIGNTFQSFGTSIGIWNIDGVSFPIAIGLWMMMLPVLTKVKYEILPSMLRRRELLRQLGISTFMNWVIGPALMTGLAWMCLPDLQCLRNGVILVGIARCIAMVLVWNDIAQGDVELCAILVALNSILQVILYTPFAYFYLNILSNTATHVGFWQVAKSVLIFLGIPLAGGISTRYCIMHLKGIYWLEDVFIPAFSPVSLVFLLYTIIVMFASQGEKITHQVGDVLRVSIPLLLYFAIMFFSSFYIAWKKRYSYKQSVAQAFTAAGNNFELAIAIAIATFGINSDEALAATIGPLIEVPALLGLSYVSLWIDYKYYQ